MVEGTPVAAVILAGGGGERLGGIAKAFLRVGGIPAIGRVVAAVAGCSPLLVARGNLPSDRFAGLDGIVLMPPEGHPLRGPVAGLAAAAEHLGKGAGPPAFLLSVAADTPFFPAGFAAAALAGIAGGAGAVFASHDGQSYPTNALWRLDALAALLAREGDAAFGMGPRGLLRRLDALPLEWPEQAGGDPFASINTPGDLIAAQRRALNESKRDFGLGKQNQTR